MSDQQRTETAADNCEVLRARLARYEDAEGVPLNNSLRELEVLREYREASINYNNSHGVETESMEEAVEIELKAESRLEAAEKACHDFYAGCKQEPSHGEQVREIERLNYRYQREVYGLNNEGDPIGGDPAGGYANDNARLRKELAALKAQPVGVVLPDRVAMAKALCKHHAEQCGVNADDQWKVYSENFFEDVDVMLAAAPSAGSQKERE